MKILPNSTSATKDPYIRHPRYENLSVIPYVHGRLVFAELAARAIDTGQYDRVLVDLPSFLNGGEIGSVLTGLFPAVSSLVICNTKGRFISIPFAPNDAAACTVAATQRIAGSGQSVQLEFVDDAQVINYQEYLNYPEPTLQDDYAVHVDGLSAYFSRPFFELDAIWKKLPEHDRFYLHYRASQVATHIASHLVERTRTLLVCDYRLWQLVTTCLEQHHSAQSSPLILPWSDLSAALVLEDPHQFWALGLLDDYPAVVQQFWENMNDGNLETFDKLDSLNTLITTCLSEKEGQISCRKTTCFQRYLSTRLAAGRRHCPTPVTHLYDAAHACTGPHFAQSLASSFLNYPALNPQEVYDYLSIQACSITRGQPPFNIPDLVARHPHYATASSISIDDCYEERFSLISRVRPYLTRGEKKLLRTGNNNGPWWAITPDYDLHEIACDRVRVAVRRQMHTRNHRALRSRGSMGAGIHMKATINALARGENSIYIKQYTANSTKHPHLDEATPIVFLFEDDLSGHETHLVHDSNITLRRKELGIDDRNIHEDLSPDFVNSLYATYNHGAVMCAGHLACDELTSIVFLHTRHMGVQRYEAINRLPTQFQCRTSPSGDSELRIFTRTELGTAWAIKYANSCIVVVARAGWKPSPSLQAYANLKQVEIIVLPLTSFAPDMIRRIRSMHFTTTAMKRHPHRDRILDRFIPDY
ncbi:MAG: hypothetical protein KZQ96_20695 [Candidatus Thiodiazotropha sp. (ex Lucinoma borealis)]|nr:hypothetical protein [Candidatus Thiodiazotropha sp. (ex Lucinoma borealis)]